VKEQYTVVTRKGQITVPAPIRKALGLKVGDRVVVSLDEDGEPRANVRPLHSVADRTFGAVPPRKRPEDFDELRRMFVDDADERDTRTKRSM